MDEPIERILQDEEEKYSPLPHQLRRYVDIAKEDWLGCCYRSENEEFTGKYNK